jgi:hypothetical protein
MRITRVVTLIILLVPAIAVHTLHAQDTLGFKGFRTPKFPGHINTLKTSPVALFAGQIIICGELRFTLEHMITHNQSISLGLSYNYPNPFLLLAASISHSNIFKRYGFEGARVILEYRYYPLKQLAPKGFFVGPIFSYNFVDIRDKRASNSFVVLNYLDAGVITGYQVIAGRHFEFEIFGGMGYRNNYLSRSDRRNNALNRYINILPPLKGFEHFKVFLQINFGYAF